MSQPVDVASQARLADAPNDASSVGPAPLWVRIIGPVILLALIFYPAKHAYRSYKPVAMKAAQSAPQSDEATEAAAPIVWRSQFKTKG